MGNSYPSGVLVSPAIVQPHELFGPMHHEFVRSKDESLIPRRYRYECSSRADDDGHDSYEFIWDNSVNLSDPVSLERVRAHTLLNSGRVTCRCGQQIWYRSSLAVDLPLPTEKSSVQTQKMISSQASTVMFGKLHEMYLDTSTPAGTFFVCSDFDAVYVRTPEQGWKPILKETVQKTHATSDVQERKVIRVPTPNLPNAMAACSGTTIQEDGVTYISNSFGRWAVYSVAKSDQLITLCGEAKYMHGAISAPEGTIFRDADTGIMHIMESGKWTPYAQPGIPLLTPEELKLLRERLGLDKPSADEQHARMTDQLASAIEPIVGLRQFMENQNSTKMTTPQLSNATNIIQEPSMTTDAAITKPSLIGHAIDTVKSDGADAAWRVACNQFVRLARDPLVAKLSEQLAPGDADMRVKVAAFLGTEAGEAAISLILALGLQLAPKSLGNVPKRLAKELRVKAMAGGLDLAAELVTKPLRELMTSGILDDAIDAAQEQVRVQDDFISESIRPVGRHPPAAGEAQQNEQAVTGQKAASK